MNAVPMVIASARGQCATVPAIPLPFGHRVGAHAAQWPIWLVVHGETAVLQLISVKRDVVEEDMRPEYELPGPGVRGKYYGRSHRDA